MSYRDRITLHCGDCLDVLPMWSADSVDAVVTDPPYGLAFMGKSWDHGVPGVPFWEAVSRVVKPGGHMLAFGGTRTFHRLTCAIEDSGWEIRDCLMWVYGSGFPKSRNLSGDWQGWGTALKPAWEPIILARKPLVGTVAASVAQWGVGGLHIDACRVSHNEPFKTTRRKYTSGQLNRVTNDGRDMSRWEASHSGGGRDLPASANPSGRFPANFIHDGSDEAAAPLGDAARYFYCAKASRSERGEGNSHPTVKPLALCRYLVSLITPLGGTVLDPFAGSGSTLVAAAELGFRAVGIERDPTYADIAERRCR